MLDLCHGTHIRLRFTPVLRFTTAYSVQTGHNIIIHLGLYKLKLDTPASQYWLFLYFRPFCAYNCVTMKLK